jgi:hypothetical protein
MVTDTIYERKPMNHSSTLFLRGVIVFIGIIVLAICLIALPQAIRGEMAGDFDYLPLLLGLYVPAVPFFIALYQALKLLGYIDKDMAFTSLSVKALRHIKYCAFIVSALFATGMPYIFYLADRDDAPGVAAIGFVIVGASFVIGAATSLFEQLFQNAVDIKSENDLTV